MLELPEFNVIKQKAEQGGLLALTHSMTFDHETAISLAGRFIDRSFCVLLESATGGPGNVARYSFLGVDRLWEFRGKGGKGEIRSFSGSEPELHPISEDIRDPLIIVQELFDELQPVSVETSLSVHRQLELAKMSGAFGYLGYDVSGLYEPSIGSPPEKKLGLWDYHFVLPKNLFVLDHLSKALHYIRFFDVRGFRGNDERLGHEYKKEQREIREVVRELLSAYTPPKLSISDAPLDFDRFASTFPKEKFLKAAERCLEEIRAGEVFQIQIGNRISTETEAHPFDIFRHLRMLNPSPYMFYYKFDDDVILGASPEMMVQVEDGWVTHRPIAGTRKRTWNAVTDAKMKEELTCDKKERAEHVMLVDLSRNDIGRISEPGTVIVDDLMMVEEYSHVFHMVSQVRGKLKEGLTSADAMRTSFPNGTMSGAPKIRAMQLINELEPVSREYYAGSLGLLTFDKQLKSTILIRSMHVSEGVASTHASAGMVFDSVPELEWKETRNKMAACATAIQNTLNPG